MMTSILDLPRLSCSVDIALINLTVCPIIQEVCLVCTKEALKFSVSSLVWPENERPHSAHSS